MSQPSNPRIILAGGSGFLGISLASVLAKRGYQSIILTRSRDLPPATDSIRYVTWDAKSPGPWAAQLENAHAIINLVGRSVDCRKTPANKKEILESRLDSVRVLAAAWEKVKNP